jgi:hypothetical protein
MASALEQEDKILKQIGLELMFSNPQNRIYADGLTSVELAKRFDLKLEMVKKKLNILLEKGIARSSGISPKFWIFDDYNFQRMPEDDPVYELLCCFDDVDFQRFFEY